MRILACALAFASAATAAAAAAPSQITAEYRLTNMGVVIGRVTETYQRTGDSYSIQSVTRSEGMLKLLMDDQLVAESKGKVTAGGLQPHAYDQRRLGNSSRDIKATFDWEKGIMHSQYKGESNTVRLPRETQDRLSLMYQFMNMNMKPREGNVTMHMSNGRKVELYTYRLVAEETIDTPAGAFQTRHYERVRSNDRESRAGVWLAKDRFNFPVRVVFDDPKGLRLEQTLVALESR